MPVTPAFQDLAAAVNSRRLGVFPQIPLPAQPYWGAAKANAKTQRATVALTGDSVTFGLNSSNPLTKSWAGLLTGVLQAKYGDGGSGVKPAWISIPGFATRGSITSQLSTAYQAIPGLLWSLVGTWTADTVGGPGGGPSLKTTDTATPAIATATLRGSSVSLYMLTNAALGSFDYRIDGGAWVTGIAVNTPNVGVQKTTVSGLSSGTHTLDVRINTSPIYIVAASGENTTGVVVNNYGLPGAASAQFNNSDGWGGGAGAWSGGYHYPADLVIYALGVNDAAGNVTGDTWSANARKYLDSVYSTGTALGNTDLILLMENIGNNDNTNAKYQDYRQKAIGLAQAYNGIVVDVAAALGRNSYLYWTNAGLWGDGTNPGGAGTDGVHPSDAGHSAIATLIEDFVL